jgi:hypothetical protein
MVFLVRLDMARPVFLVPQVQGAQMEPLDRRARMVWLLYHRVFQEHLKFREFLVLQGLLVQRVILVRLDPLV